LSLWAGNWPGTAKRPLTGVSGRLPFWLLAAEQRERAIRAGELAGRAVLEQEREQRRRRAIELDHRPVAAGAILDEDGHGHRAGAVVVRALESGKDGAVLVVAVTVREVLDDAELRELDLGNRTGHWFLLMGTAWLCLMD
jgi:hypothetical protein